MRDNEGTGAHRMEKSRWRKLVGIVVLLLAANLAAVVQPSRLVVFCAGLILTCFLPGSLLTQMALSRGARSDWVEEAILAVGLGFSTLILGTLGLHYVPGPLRPVHVLVLYDGLIVAFIVILSLRPRTGRPVVSRPSFYQYLLPLALVLAAGFFRVTNLGYSEFQGDESRAVLMSAGVIRGEDNILFLHRKGPAEILIPTVFYALQNSVTELTARLPFALASIAGVLTIYALTRRLFPHRIFAAYAAAGLLAVDGYLVAFGRLVQYQSIVFLMVALAAWCFYSWYQNQETVLLLLGALFVAVGTLAHYEAVLVLPFLAWLYWARGRRDNWTLRLWIGRALGPIAVFIIAWGVFYVPFVRHPHFLTDTAEYITEERIGGRLLYNNIQDVFFRATFYNSTYYILFLSLGALVLVMVQLRKALLPTRVVTAIQAAFVFGLAVVALSPQALVVQGLNLAFLPFALVLAALVASPGVTDELKATFLWFGVPFIVALFLTDRPKTHVYTIFPAWAILVGVAFSQLGADLRTRLNPGAGTVRALKAGAILLSTALLIVFGYYVYIVFVRHTPDFRRGGYPDTRPPLYTTFYGDWEPSGGGFAFPHRGGWKAVGALYAQGVLQGSFRSNEEPITTSWYTRRAPWCGDSPDYYFISHVTHDRWDIHPNRVRRNNNHLGDVWADGELVLEIYTSRPVDAPVDYQLAELEPVFDDATRMDVWLWALKDPVPQHHVDASLEEKVSLFGYDAPQQVAAGETLSTVLYWRPLKAFDRYYNVFVHVEVEGGRIYGQSDEAPACGAESTKKWQPEEVVVDGHTLRIDPSTPPGEYPLVVGLYDPMTGERVSVKGRDANAWGNAVHLGTIQVVAGDISEGAP
jgi:4-amino-4-deoxy-L-arabinose transferase-like glycosyltransferase